MSWGLLGLWLLGGICWLFLTACGYRSLVAGPSFRVDEVRVMVPQPSLGVCLSRELRLLAGTPPSSAPAGDSFRLVGELIRADQQFGSVIWRGGYRPLDQQVELALRMRLLAPGGGLVWGPAVYRLVQRVPSPSTDSAAVGLAVAQEGLRWSCQAVALQVVDDIRLFLSESPAPAPGR